ncbi:MAG TPA: YHS domain-containing (seleno)protein [Thermoanaerobaculia bacterium]|nr:YHS domain-containing (seleno)protein [Thermoanaerobaculia bacterium]
MKSIVRALAVLVLFSSPLVAADLINVSGASKAAIDGFDPVAFFTDSRPVNGSPSITAMHKGAVYYFATEEHKRMFEQNPEKYAPQYGGFCAYGVAVNALFPVDISTWQVRDGKLYLNLNPEILKKFNADFGGYVAQANKNWPGLVAKNAG